MNNISNSAIYKNGFTFFAIVSHVTVVLIFLSRLTIYIQPGVRIQTIRHGYQTNKVFSKQNVKSDIKVVF